MAYTCEAKQGVEIEDFSSVAASTAWSHCPLEFGRTIVELEGDDASILRTEISSCFHRDLIYWARDMEYGKSDEECIRVEISLVPKNT